jgi:hypothetical protein
MSIEPLRFRRLYLPRLDAYLNRQSPDPPARTISWRVASVSSPRQAQQRLSMTSSSSSKPASVSAYFLSSNEGAALRAFSMLRQAVAILRRNSWRGCFQTSRARSGSSYQDDTWSIISQVWLNFRVFGNRREDVQIWGFTTAGPKEPNFLHFELC